MHDIRAIRLDPDAYDTGWAKRGVPPVAVQLIALDEARRAAQTALQQALTVQAGVVTTLPSVASQAQSLGHLIWTRRLVPQQTAQICWPSAGQPRRARRVPQRGQTTDHYCSSSAEICQPTSVTAQLSVRLMCVVRHSV